MERFKFRNEEMIDNNTHILIKDMIENYSTTIGGSYFFKSIIKTQNGYEVNFICSSKTRKVLITFDDIKQYQIIKLMDMDDFTQRMNDEVQDFMSETSYTLHQKQDK